MREFTEEEKNEILTYANENGISAAAAAYNVSINVLRSWNKKLNIYTPKEKLRRWIDLSVEEDEEIVAFLKTPGNSLAAACKKFNMSKATLEEIRTRHEHQLYPHSLKRECLIFAKEHSIDEAMVEYKVSRQKILLWNKNLNNILSLEQSISKEMKIKILTNAKNYFKKKPDAVVKNFIADFNKQEKEKADKNPNYKSYNITSSQFYSWNQDINKNKARSSEMPTWSDKYSLSATLLIHQGLNKFKSCLNSIMGLFKKTNERDR